VDQLLPPRRNRPSLHAAGEMAAEALGFMARGANGGRAAELVTRDFLGGCAGSDDARDASARNDAVVSPSAPVLCVLEFGKPLSLSLLPPLFSTSLLLPRLRRVLCHRASDQPCLRR
jgi:hypothetical protein